METLKAAEILVKEGFTVLPYINADPVLAKRLEEVGTATVMPLGSPIGTNRGLKTGDMIRIIIEQATVPVVVDAGLGAPSHAAEAMEMGADAVLVNTALADAWDHAAMATGLRPGGDGRPPGLPGRPGPGAGRGRGLVAVNGVFGVKWHRLPACACRVGTAPRHLVPKLQLGNANLVQAPAWTICRMNRKARVLILCKAGALRKSGFPSRSLGTSAKSKSTIFSFLEFSPYPCKEGRMRNSAGIAPAIILRPAKGIAFVPQRHGSQVIFPGNKEGCR